MKSLRSYVLGALVLGCFMSTLEAKHCYSRPFYRYYQPVTYYQEVLEDSPDYVAEPMYVRRAYPVRVFHHKHYCHRPVKHVRHPFFGGFSFSVGF